MAKEQKNANSNPNATPEQIAKIAMDFLQNFRTMSEFYGLTEDHLEAMYAGAYNYYTHGKYKEAEDLFKTLCRLNQFEPKYFQGLAASRQMLKKWQPAIEAYGMAMYMDPLNVVPAFHTSECYLELGDKDAAARALKLVVDVVEQTKDPKFLKLKERAANLLKNMSEKSAQSKKSK